MKGVSCVSLTQLQLALCSVHVLATELRWCWEDCWAVWAWWLEHTVKICSSFTSLWGFVTGKRTATGKHLTIWFISLFFALSLSPWSCYLLTYLSLLFPLVLLFTFTLTYWIASLWHSGCRGEIAPTASFCYLLLWADHQIGMTHS